MAEAAFWYEQREPGLGDRFKAAVDATKLLIQEQPGLGAPHRRQTRMRLVKRCPYHVIYRELEDKIVIVAVAHGKRLPGYWEDRLS
jgi:plasmid stabilization system protein ParE